MLLLVIRRSVIFPTLTSLLLLLIISNLLFNASINAGTGAVSARGESVGSADDYAMGILLRGDAGTSSITGGAITLVGISNNAGNGGGAGSSNRGISLINSSITGTGNITLTGTGSAGVGGTSANNTGIYLNGATVSSSGGSISLVGNGRGTYATANGVTLQLNGWDLIAEPGRAFF